MTEKAMTTLTGVAVAVLALSRFMAATNPKFGAFLQSTLDSATEAGIKPEDLELLRTIVKAATLG